MNDICVSAEKLSKRFFVLKRKQTALGVLKALVSGEPLKREYWVLRDITLRIHKGEKLAIVGKNGSGKTTLLRIITGIYDRTYGDLEVKEEPRALFGCWTALNADLSVIDNIYLFGAVHGIQRGYLKGKISEIMEMTELYDLQFCALKELSMGQMQRLALSVFFQIPNDFLIFDESLASVDQGFTQKCEAYFNNLVSSEKTVIMTSHDNRFLRKYCNKAIWLDEGRIRMSGEASSVIDEYENSFKPGN